MLKKYDSLYINGCSNIWGHGIKNEEDKCPNLLSKKLDLPIYKNSSLCGNSMKGILYSTVNDLKKVENTLCVIGLTFQDRSSISFGNHQYNYSYNSYEYINEKDWHTKHFLDKRRYQWKQDNTKDKNLENVFKSYANYKNELIKHDNKFETNLYREFFYDIVLLQSFLVSQKIDYVFIEWHNHLDVSVIERKRKIELNCYRTEINFDNILNIEWDEMDINPGTGHPSILGCKNISEKVYDFISR